MDSPARILFATYSLAFQNPGGGELVLRALRKGLQRKGHTVDLFNPFEHDVRDYDLIHFFSCLETSFWEHAKERAPRTPLAVTPTLNPLPGAGAGRTSPRFGLQDLWLPSTVPEGVMLTDRHGIPRSRIRVLPNGLSDSFLKGDADPKLFREKYGLTGDFVLHVGRFHPVKNQPDLIDACAAIGAKLVLIGNADLNEGEYFERCRTKIGKTGALHVPALAQDDPLLASAYAAAKVFALPSRFETFGIAALEAAVSGCRLVLTSRMAARDLFEPLATWVETVEPDGVATGIQAALAAGPEPATHLARRQWLRENLGWSRITDELIAAYGERLGSPRRSRPPEPRA